MTTSRILWGIGIVVAGIFLLWGYKYSPRKIEFSGHYKKIGAHRVNSLDKLKKSLSSFDAIELDLVFDPETNVLDVHHPTAPSTGLTFTRYVAALGDKQPFMWLDIKNLDKSNAELILQKLNSVFLEKNYPKQNVLIETRFPEKLGLFTKAGYKTSYYLKQDLYKLKQTELHTELEQIKTILETQPKVGISTEHFDYEILKEYFPETTKYIWCIRHSKIGDYTLVRNMLKDETVALVLVTYHPL